MGLENQSASPLFTEFPTKEEVENFLNPPVMSREVQVKELSPEIILGRWGWCRYTAMIMMENS